MKKVKSQALKILREQVRKKVAADHLSMMGKGFRKHAEPGYSKEERGRGLGRNVNVFGHFQPVLLQGKGRVRRGQAVPL